jgi:hypothetical protein
VARQLTIQRQQWEDLLADYRVVTNNTSEADAGIVQQVYLTTSSSTLNVQYLGTGDYKVYGAYTATPLAFNLYPAKIVGGWSGAKTWLTDQFAQPTPSAVANHPLERLISGVRTVFPNAKISLSTQTDEEEGWSRPLLNVETGVDDPDELSKLEEKFYVEVENHETLIAALKTTTVLFM